MTDMRNETRVSEQRLSTIAAYPEAVREATAVLNATGLHMRSGRPDPDRATRIVDTVLGAALRALEAPWRIEVRELRDYVDELSEIRRAHERARAAYAHVSEVEAEQRRRADDAEREREAARDLAVRLEAEIAEIDAIVADVGRGDRLERLEALLEIRPYTGEDTQRLTVQPDEESDR